MKTLFPEELARLQYFVRCLVLLAVLVGGGYGLSALEKNVALPNWSPAVMILAGFAYKLLCLDIPRLRNSDRSPWLLLLFFLPPLYLLLQISLFARPPVNYQGPGKVGLAFGWVLALGVVLLWGFIGYYIYCNLDSHTVAAARGEIKQLTASVSPARPSEQTLRLKAIFYNSSRASAVISDKTVFVNDKVGTWLVKAIGPRSVTLQNTNGETNTLSLK
jgi:uncharacterized membrane protein YhaH (DUF805 family)